MMVAVVGSDFWRESGVRRSVCVGAFGRNLPCHFESVLSVIYLMVFFFLFFFTFNAICKDNTAINVIRPTATQQDEFLSTLTRHTMLAIFLKYFLML
jgi:hypothetical protein